MGPTYILIISAIISISMSAEFKVYWNVPTDRCHKHNVFFDLSEYNMIQNTNDKWYGDQVVIIYAPGNIPHYKGNESVWSGIPQKGDIVKHTLYFQKQVETETLSNFSGVIIMDAEDYLPYYDVAPKLYQEKSLEWAKTIYPDWPVNKQEKLAELSFNELSKLYFETLLDLGKQLRPGALWGYYHYPYCGNSPPSRPNCSSQQMKANEELDWIFEESTALYPSIYIYKENFDPVSRSWQVQTRLENTLNIRKPEQPIFPYFWYRYHNVDEYLDPIDLWSTIGVMWKMNMDGMIIWGGYSDVDSKEKCLNLQKYVQEVLGPVLKVVTEFNKRDM